MVEDCVNSLKLTSLSYSLGLLTMLFQVKSGATVASAEVTEIDTHKPKKLKAEVNPVRAKAPAKIHPKGYDKKTKALASEATIVNVQVPNGEEHLIHISNELTNAMNKPRASVCLSQQRNKHTED